MTPALTGEVQNAPPPELETLAPSISAARDEIEKDLDSGALMVSARKAKLLLQGFDMLIQHTATAHKKYEADCNRIVALRLGSAMHVLGADRVTLGDHVFQTLKDQRVSLNSEIGANGTEVTYFLTYPDSKVNGQ